MFEYLSALGVGALLATIAQYLLSVYRDKTIRAFNEKKEAYVGLLEAYRDASVKPSNETSKEFAYWQIRCELVASHAVVKAIQKIIDSNGNETLRAFAHDNMVKQMRIDLGTAKR